MCLEWMERLEGREAGPRNGVWVGERNGGALSFAASCLLEGKELQLPGSGARNRVTVELPLELFRTVGDFRLKRSCPTNIARHFNSLLSQTMNHVFVKSGICTLLFFNQAMSFK